MRIPAAAVCWMLAMVLASNAPAANKPAGTPTPAPKKKQAAAPDKPPAKTTERTPTKAEKPSVRTPEKAPGKTAATTSSKTTRRSTTNTATAKKSTASAAKKPSATAPVPEAAKQPPPDPEASRYVRVNSLGMKFVAVGDVQFCIWPVRLDDYGKYSDAIGATRGRWSKPGFPQTPDHPVVNVTWKEAVKFCAWLTELEHASGKLEPSLEYRLPTDLEWSKAVGLADEAGGTPEDRDLSDPDSYPWGKAWPPPPGSANVAGAESATDLPIENYRDDFANTSPVGSFTQNALGIYDMAGNVFQWCNDPIRPGAAERTLRGSSWFSGALPVSMLSSCRIKAAPDLAADSYGFRVVVARR